MVVYTGIPQFIHTSRTEPEAVPFRWALALFSSPIMVPSMAPRPSCRSRRERATWLLLVLRVALVPSMRVKMVGMLGCRSIVEGVRGVPTEPFHLLSCASRIGSITLQLPMAPTSSKLFWISLKELSNSPPARPSSNLRPRSCSPRIGPQTGHLSFLDTISTGVVSGHCLYTFFNVLQTYSPCSEPCLFDRPQFCSIDVLKSQFGYFFGLRHNFLLLTEHLMGRTNNMPFFLESFFSRLSESSWFNIPHLSVVPLKELKVWAGRRRREVQEGQG